MVDACPRCEAPRVALAVPDSLAEYVDSDALACCTRCLRADACDLAAVDGPPAFEAIHDRFPSGDGGVALVLLLQQLDSLALNRASIESLVAFLDSNGVDLFLMLDRLLAAPDIEPYLDLQRRRDQLESLL